MAKQKTVVIPISGTPTIQPSALERIDRRAAYFAARSHVGGIQISVMTEAGELHEFTLTSTAATALKNALTNAGA